MSVALKRLSPAPLKLQSSPLPDDAGLIGSSPEINKMVEAARQVSTSKASVFITGQSGTGKEVCAELIHAWSDRANARFVAVNCGAIPRELIESELFGHLKGSFTGAVSDRQGAAALADGGTLFLDEVCELELSLQTRLLRFLQTGLIQPVGSSSPRPVDIRVICATNRDPKQDVADGRLRKDLFYRLYVIPIEVPALCERGHDIIELADYYLKLYAAEEGKSFHSLSVQVQECLSLYEWPGNVRELQNVMRRIVVLNEGECVELHMLPDDFKLQKQNVVPFGNPGANVSQSHGHRELWMMERDYIEETIIECGGSIPQAARRLGVSPSTIYRKKEAWLQG